uniref:Uncharacterized protein n=1 Tax=Romanomermis culicivorax TaxID=13658 RepID=A0A915HWM5_ROMCU
MDESAKTAHRQRRKSKPNFEEPFQKIFTFLPSKSCTGSESTLSIADGSANSIIFHAVGKIRKDEEEDKLEKHFSFSHKDN